EYNFLTRWPRRTTPRVFSGWVASMRILLGIDQSLDGRLALRSPPDGRRKTGRPETGPTVVETMSPVRARDRAGDGACADRRNSHGVVRRRHGAWAAIG